VPIQLAHCRFPGLAISNAKILINLSKKYTDPILSNSSRKVLCFEIAEMLIGVNKNIESIFIIIYNLL